MTRKFDGYDVFYFDETSNRWRRCHNGVFTTKKAAQDRMKYYQSENYSGTSWNKKLKIAQANVR